MLQLGFNTSSVLSRVVLHKAVVELLTFTIYCIRHFVSYFIHFKRIMLQLRI